MFRSKLLPAALLLAVAILATFVSLSRGQQQLPGVLQPKTKPTHSASPGTFTVSIEGAKQGRFKGEGTKESNKDTIVGLRFDYDLKTAAATMGKRQHSPIVISKEWGAASPQLLQAAATNEPLKSVVLDFYEAKPSGEVELFYTIRLTNAQITLLKQYTENGLYYEDVSLTFQKIDVEHKSSKTSASDDLR